MTTILLKRRVAVLLLGLAAAATAQAEQRQVLMLLETSGRVAADLLQGGVESRLNDTPDLRLYIEHYDAGRFPDANQRSILARYLKEKYAGIPIDVAIAVGPASLSFFTEYGPSVFPSTPVVFAAISETNPVLRNLPPRSTGVVSYFDVAGTLELVLALQPEVRRVAFVTGDAALDRRWRAVAREQVSAYGDRLQAVYLTAQSLSHVEAAVANLPADTVVMFLTLMNDVAGNTFVRMNDISARIAAASIVPAYGVYETYVGTGVIGGYVDAFGPIGNAAAELALRILSGEDPTTIPVTRSAGRFIVDQRQLRRWNLDAADLPPEAIIRFQEPSIWDRYRFQILAVLSLVALQTLLIVTLSLRMRKRRLERELRETEHRYRHIVEAQTDLICRYLPDTTLTFVNDEYCRYFGRTRADLLGSRFIDLIPRQLQDEVCGKISSLLEQPRTETFEHQVTTADGRTAWLEWIDRVILDSRNAVVEIQGIGRDITRQKVAEQEAQDRRDEVLHLTRVAILGELSGALAHELNQPLTAILGNAQVAEQLLQRPTVDTNELQEILSDIIADDIRAGAVITRLRALLKRGATDMQPLDLNALVSDVLTLAHSQLVARNVRLTSHLAVELPDVRGDRVQLQQVLLNLLINACEAVVSNGVRDGEITIATSVPADGKVRIAVTDNGPGFPPDAAARLFEPFFTTKPTGLGLGLSLCRSIIAAHGGHLAARNNDTRGSTVEFTLTATESSSRRTSTHVGRQKFAVSRSEQQSAGDAVG